MNAIYSWMIDGASPEGREQFDALVFKAPVGVKAAVIAELPEWQPEAQASNFMAQLAARGSNARTSG